MGNLLSIRNYDLKCDLNWLCEKCNLKFGAIPDENGLVRCSSCGNTNSESSRQNILYHHLKTGGKEMERRKRVLSGIRPTGNIHLGNYFGAIKQFVELQNEGEDCWFFIADLHALTTSNKPEEIDKYTFHVVKCYLACGLDPDKSYIYRQSDIPEIPYLSTLLSMITPEPLLRRCTTFKDKAQKQEIVSLGLLSYPVLMASDILIMEAEIIPVGEDQLQHLEIVREIATKFNQNFGDVFKLPKSRELKAIRVPGLDGTGKMGKSDGNTIDLIEEPKNIIQKIKGAKTDLGPVKNQEMSQEMINFYFLMELCSPPDVYNKYKEMYESGKQKFYGEMKKQLANDIIELLSPIRDRYHSEVCSDDRVRRILCTGRDRVRPISARVLQSVQRKFGLHNQEIGLFTDSVWP